MADERTPPHDQTDDDAEAVTLPIEPELDLHSFAPRDIPSVVDEYLHEAARAGMATVRLVHGRGRGVQRAIVQARLEAHPLVQAFDDDPASHLGATIVQLVRSR
ncbi:MAG: Smr/MutS family protein [Vicinamibacterales bacterium]